MPYFKQGPRLALTPAVALSTIFVSEPGPRPFSKTLLRNHCLRALLRSSESYPQGAIRFRTGIPNYEAIFGEQPGFHDWMYSIYGTPQEDVPEGIFPPPKGKEILHWHSPPHQSDSR
eukprot:scaffold1752_cov188-Amphora_coffeaeformis.AAC.13